jgi:hypothetical protein
MDSFTIPSWEFNTKLWAIQDKMHKAKLGSEKQYWIGFIGGMNYVKQLSGDKK